MVAHKFSIGVKETTTVKIEGMNTILRKEAGGAVTMASDAVKQEMKVFMEAKVQTAITKRKTSKSFAFFVSVVGGH